MARRSRHWTDFTSRLTDILEGFADNKQVTLGPMPIKEALNTRNEIYRFRTSLNTAVRARDDLSEELIRLHDIARELVIYVDGVGADQAVVRITENAFATAPIRFGYEKLLEADQTTLPQRDGDTKPQQNS